MPSRHEAKVLRRRSIRLPGFDYTRNDSYFVTVCAANQACLLGRVINAVMHLSRLGQIVAEEWQRTVLLRPYVESDAFVVMPNHFHALFTLLREGPPRCEFESLESGRSTLRPYTPTQCGNLSSQPPNSSGRSTLRPYTSTPPAAGSVGAILRAFKAAVTRRGRVEAGHLGPVWQRNYYEHIIRNDQEYLRARDYIARNAESWEIDKENPQQRR